MAADGQRASAIPVGSQFTPGLIELPNFLDAIVKHSGNKDAMEQAVWEPDVRIKRPSRPPTRRQRSLPLEAAVQYGLLEEKTYEATELADDLKNLKPPHLYERFARHILFNCGGLRVLEGIQQMEADGLKVTGDSLAKYLSDQGFNIGVHNTAINSMRMWLAKAGIFPVGRSNAWKIDTDAKETIVGLHDDTIQALSGLTRQQRAFVEGLCVIDPPDWHPANEVRDWAESIKGVEFGRASLPKEVLRPLEDAGIIEFETKGTSGGKPSQLRTTATFRKEILFPFVRRTLEDLDPVIRQYYKTRPEDIYADLASPDTYTKGKALEAYAIHIMRQLGLRFLGWRKRATVTGGAEVDAILMGMIGGLPTRWQLQCKNTPRGRVRLEDVAKEVGLVPVTSATHLLFVANCAYTDEAVKFAEEVMRRSTLTLFLLDADDFKRVKESPGAIARILRLKAEKLIHIGARDTVFDWEAE